MSARTPPQPHRATSHNDDVGSRHGWARIWRRARAPVGIALLIAFLICRGSALLSPVELYLLDLWLSERPARQPDPRIVLVAFEQAEVEHHRATSPEDCTCNAISRNQLAHIVSAVWRGGARVLVLDVGLKKPCPHGRGTPDAHDQPLAEALCGPGETVVAAATTLNPSVTYFDRPAGELAGCEGREHVLGSPVLYTPGGVVRGVSLIQTGAPSGLASPDATALEGAEIVVPPLSAAAWAAIYHRGHEIPVPCDAHHVECVGRRIPVWPSASIYLMERFMPEPEQNRHAMLINWVGPVGTFPMYRATSVTAADDDDDVESLRRWFDGRIVIVGSAIERLNTPRLGTVPPQRAHFVDQSREMSMSGLEIHANALQALLHGRYIEPISTTVAGAVVILSSLVAALAFRYLRAYVAVAVVGAELAVLPAAALLLIRADLWFYVALPAVALLLSGASTAVWGYARSLKRADELAEEVAEREAATATIVHDLKQPLAAISTMAQVLRHRSGDADGEMDPELANRILRQVENALADIDDLLIASPERNLPLDIQRFDLAALARDLAAAQGLKSDLHDVEVVTDAGGVMVEGDPRYLGRVLSNLVDNAIKYWPEGGTVRVEVETMSGHAIVRVVDEGIGMTPEQQELCFERYRRVVPEGMHIPGTGIGLYSVQRIAMAHGGRVQVVSAPGVGSTFVVMLPLSQSRRSESSEVRLT